MTECQCDPIASRFDEAYAAEKLELYRSAGADPSSRALIEAISTHDVRGRTLLDIGGGVGAIQHELLRRGLDSVQEVEASPAYGAACRTEAERLGHADRIRHLSGTFASVADAVDPADIVTLNRSVCCWHDPLTLLDQAAAKSRWLFGLVYPRDVWWVRHGWRHLGNIRQVLSRSSLRLSTPRAADIEAVLGSHGLHRGSQRSVGVWQIAVFAMEPGGAG